MITEVKSQLRDAAIVAGLEFVSKSHSELEDFVQNYAFEKILVNLEPFKSYPQKVMPSGAVGYTWDCNIYFLTPFQKSNHLEESKDALIDQTIIASEAFVNALNKNVNQVFINPRWEWRSEIIRQHTSNLLCGCKLIMSLDTACNRVQGGIEGGIESSVN